MENVNIDTSNYEDNSKIMGTNAEFDNESSKENIALIKKRKREEDKEAKRVAEEQYVEEMQEKQYKRLMHLLNRSKFFSAYIFNKIDDNMKEKENANKKPRTKKVVSQDENVPPEDKRKKKQILQKYISQNVQEKINMNKDKLINKNKLSPEDIQNELIADSDNEIKNDNNNFEVPKYFNGELRDYQIQGFKWLKVLYENGINGILADEMGLGKTVQIIALLCHLFENQQIGPYLIIVPLSTMPNWISEFKRFAPELPIVTYHGEKYKRTSTLPRIKRKYHITDSYSTQPIVLTTFEMPLMDKHIFQAQHWKYIIVDEGHRIKNHECDLVKVLKDCKSMNRLLMTGTPLQNNLTELWALLNFLLPEIFNDLAVFESWFDAKTLQYDEGTKKFLKLEQEKHVLASLREILQPFMLRREKSDVCLEVPKKKELVIYAPLSELQHTLYKEILNRNLNMISKTVEPEICIIDGKRPKRRAALKNITDYNYDKPNDNISDNESLDSFRESNPKNQKLLEYKQYVGVSNNFFLNITRDPISMYKKIVNHPYLVRYPLDGCGLPLVNEDLVKVSGKLLVLDAMFPKLKSQGHKILLFSTMTTILDMIEDYLSMRSYKYVRLDGGNNYEERKISIEEFNSNPNVFLFLLSTRAGGVGLNLTAADTVIIYDSDWNPQMDLQATARCHRIGQKKPVVIYKLCTEGTIDEIIMNRADKKRILEKMVISKKTKAVNINDKGTLLELQKSFESKDCRIVASNNEVFTEEELNKLLDRSDLYEDVKPKEP